MSSNHPHSLLVTQQNACVLSPLPSSIRLSQREAEKSRLMASLVSVRANVESLQRDADALTSTEQRLRTLRAEEADVAVLQRQCDATAASKAALTKEVTAV